MHHSDFRSTEILMYLKVLGDHGGLISLQSFRCTLSNYFHLSYSMNWFFVYWVFFEIDHQEQLWVLHKYVFGESYSCLLLTNGLDYLTVQSSLPSLLFSCICNALSDPEQYFLNCHVSWECSTGHTIWPLYQVEVAWHHKNLSKFL